MTRILAYRFSAFGDVAMCVPVFREILEQNPDLEIVMVTKNFFRDMFEGIPRLTFKGINLKEYSGFFKLRKLAYELTEEYQPDYVTDLHDVIRTKILDKVLKFNQYKVFVIDKGKSEKEHLTDIWNLDKKQLKRTVERYADVFRNIGMEVQLSHQLRPSAEKKEGVGFAPFAQHAGKVLPVEKSFEVARLISRHKKIYFFGGGKEEVEMLQKWAEELPNTVSLAGKQLSLREELERISRLELMISMDSANMHLASLAGTRCISVWGATHHFAGFLGYGQREEDIVQVKDLTCRPCSVFGDKECFRGDWACLHELEVQQIIERVLK